MVNRIQDGLSERSTDFGYLIKNAGNQARNFGHFTIVVTNGAHAGVKLQQTAGEITIGSDANNDIVLFADALAPHHVHVELPKNILAQIRITPVEERIVLEDGSIVEVGQYVDLDAGETFSAANTEIAINRIADPKSFIKPGLRLFALVCLVAMLPIVYSLFSGLFFGIADAGSRALSSLNPQMIISSSGLLGRGVDSNQNDADAFAWTIRTKLEDLKLNHRLKVSSASAETIRIQGSISDAEVTSWNAFLRWYDTKQNFPQLIRDVSRTTLDRNLPEVKSVWLDDQPTAFLKDGTVATVGSSLPDGWKVVSIDATSVKIERDGTFISLTY
ncbi:MAG: hypothetical protein AAF217_00835 [Pseudomonadota bacterium]